MVEVERLLKRYGDTIAVDQVSLETRREEFLTLLGPSGCGKTTILRCIAGFVRPDAGRVRIGSKDVTEVPPYRREIGMVFQSYALFPHLTVFENVAFGLRVRRLPRLEIAPRVHRALDLVKLVGLAGRLPRQLSGGQQQRVALARALVYEPRVLLLDEPLSNLDAKLRVEMRAEIRAIQRRLGLTAIYVTHDQEEALSVSDRVAVMRSGRIEQMDTPATVYDRPANAFVAGFVGVSNLLPGEVVSSDGGTTVARLGGGLDVRAAGVSVGAGRPVWIMARPETIRIEREGRAGRLMGKVGGVTLLGSVVRVGVELPPGIAVVVDVPNAGASPPVAEGEMVWVEFDPSRVVLLPRD